MEEIANIDNFNNCTSVKITGMELNFFNAAMKGNIDPFKGMGEEIESISTPNKNTILHIHFTNYTHDVSEKFVEEVLVMSPTLVLKTNVKDETMLHIAARYGHHIIVKKLIECAKVLPKDINEVGSEKTLVRAKNDKKDTALHEAVRYGKKEVVDILIKEEPDQSHFGKNIDDETPLYLAVERQYWEVVDTILSISSLPQYNGPNGRNALHAAVLHGNTEIVSKLLTRNPSAAKEADENGWVPLHLAALCASSEMVELLVSKDRSTAYMRDNKGRTAVHLAAFYEYLPIAAKILDYCPDCYELVDEKGNNAFHYTAMREGKHYFYGLSEIMNDPPLISNMSNEKNDDGNTPLHLFARLAPEIDSEWEPWEPYSPKIPRVDKMAFNKYGETVLDVAVAHVPQDDLMKNKMLRKLQDIGGRLGGRVLDKHLREKNQEKMKQEKMQGDSNAQGKMKQEKIHGDSDTVVVTLEQAEKNKQDFYGRLATTVSVVATLIATVTFTAAFTLPGGLFQDGEHKGSPILKYNAAFITFVISDSLSFVLSASAVFFLFLTSVGNEPDEGDKIQGATSSMLAMSAFLTLAALVFMVIAFGTGIYAVLGVSKGFGVITLLMVLSFFVVPFIFFWRARARARARIRDARTTAPAPDDKSHFHRDDGLERVRDFQLSFTL